MKKTLLISFLLLPLIFFAQVVTSPSPIEVASSVTITVDTNSTATDCNGFSSPSKVYMHAGVGDDSNPWSFVVGNWGLDDGVGEMTDNGDGTWSITLTPQSYFGLTSAEAEDITKMGMVFRNEDGSQEFKDNDCVDFIFNVGAFQVNMINPDANGTEYVDSDGSLTIMCSNSNGEADYELFANGTSINTQYGVTFFNFNHSGITENQYYELVITQGSSTITKQFSVVVDPGANSGTLASGLVDGINYDDIDTGAILVLDAPNKDFVYVAGSFNNWQPSTAFAMKKDPDTGKFWYHVQGLNIGEIYTYQYWVFEKNPVTDSPVLVKTADPYSTLVLSPFDDGYIPDTTYPDLPEYPEGQKREVTVLQTAQPEYPWTVTSFEKPKKEDLVIYEVLIRDFDANRSFQDLIDRISYFKDLNINVIELMPVMEFEGNEGWGYNPSFHMAVDKFYGTADKLKELVDLCHQNGIAVILDITFNHAMGRNPMVRMWMKDDDNDGWGTPSSENPYFNENATHAYGIGNDFDHSAPITKNYVKNTIKHWIQEFKIDGFRWDLTKGFTQNCATGDEACTNAYQADRVAVLKEYADYSWSLDPDHYVIFEHLGTDYEEQQWANYRISEGKGIMMWGKMTNELNQLTMGYSSSSNFDRMGHEAHGFTGKRLVGYAESHDEERLMYRNLQFGNSTNSAHDVKDLNTALSRMSALGAVTLTIPGPKMIWHFGDLGMDNSLYTCTDGGTDTECRLATKPQPQWEEDWLADTNRNQIYYDWARLNDIKQHNDVFEASYSIDSGSLTPRLYIWDDALPSSTLKNVVILANFDVVTQDVIPDFPYTGTWYDLMDNSTISVTSTTSPISLQAGEFRIFGNKEAQLSQTDFTLSQTIDLYPNPASSNFSLSMNSQFVQIFSVTGELVRTFKGDFSADTMFSVEGIQPALYFVRIQTESGRAVKRLMIK